MLLVQRSAQRTTFRHHIHWEICCWCALGGSSTTKGARWLVPIPVQVRVQVQATARVHAVGVRRGHQRRVRRSAFAWMDSSASRLSYCSWRP